MPTFSCLRCLRSFSSRYVRLDKTGVLKGFIIFLMATAWLVSWSLAELRWVSKRLDSCAVRCKHTRQDQKLPYPRAAGQCTFATSVQPTLTMWGIAAPARDFERRAENLGAHKFSH